MSIFAIRPPNAIADAPFPEELSEEQKQKLEGYWFSKEDIVTLANHIKDLEEKVDDQKNLINKLEESLKEERDKYSEIIALKDETIKQLKHRIKLKSEIIDQKDEQIKQYKVIINEKKKNKLKSNFKWGLSGAGVGAVATLFAIISK